MRFLAAIAFTLIVSSSVPAFAQEATSAVPKSTAVENNAEPNLKKDKNTGSKVTSPLVLNAPLESDHVMGNKNAPLTMIEYASLSCPHCAHFSNDILPELQKKYIDTGKMKYILRQFPLNEPALKGAMLVDCVGEQGDDKYYTFAKVLFDAQNKWAFDNNFLSALETFASVGGVTKDQFQNCVNNTDRETKVLKAKKLADTELHIAHTPFIYIGDEAFEGERSVDVMSQFIDSKLAAAGK